jgi:hypothetical protein
MDVAVRTLEGHAAIQCKGLMPPVKSGRAAVVNPLKTRNGEVMNTPDFLKQQVAATEDRPPSV